MKYFILGFIIATISSCGSAGSIGAPEVQYVVGPTGTQGITGATGLQGVTGPTGITSNVPVSPFVSHSIPVVNQCYTVVSGIYAKNKGTTARVYTSSNCTHRVCTLNSSNSCVIGRKLLTLSGTNASMSLNEMSF